MSADKYPSIFWRQMKAIVYLSARAFKMMENAVYFIVLVLLVAE